MGMDVCGKNPENATGKYFRNNVWWWHDLWDYCVQVAPEICAKVKYAHSNDGDGLNKRGSVALAKILRKKLQEGHTAEYEKAYKIRKAAIPDESCEFCKGTGHRADWRLPTILRRTM